MYCEKVATQGYLGTFTDFMSEDFPEQARTHAAGMRTSRELPLNQAAAIPLNSQYFLCC